MNPIPNSHEEWSDMDRAIARSFGTGLQRKRWEGLPSPVKRQAALHMLRSGTVTFLRTHGHYECSVKEMR